jgi:membrane protein
MATKALINAMNIAYDVNERRGFVRFYLTALILTVVGVVTTVVAIGLVAAMPAVLTHLGLDRLGEFLLRWMRWPFVVVAFMLGLAVLYRYGPNRERVAWRWVSWGAIAATVLWIIGSVIFSFYVSQFGTYNKTYGSLGAIAILLFWLYLTAFSVVAGAELNSEIDLHRPD